jgi:glycerol kinase
MSAMSDRVVASIDQGTTGTTVLLMDEREVVVGRGYREVPQHYPAPGEVEHDPEDHVRTSLEALADARAAAPSAEIAAVGITNQRETTILWERASGRPVAPAIVWQDRRTAGECAALREAGHEPAVQARTGLLLDPYFSATKIAWLLDHVPGLRARAERGELAFGTVDCFLLWRLSGGRRTSPTSPTPRARCSSICTRWTGATSSAPLPRAARAAARGGGLVGRLAEPRGVPGLRDGTPVAGIAGDQQAALYGQGCLQPGDAKCTYGTGAFLLMNVGDRPVPREPPAGQRGLARRRARPPTRSRAAPSWRARWCSGCATAWASSRRPRRSSRWRARCPTRAG